MVELEPGEELLWQGQARRGLLHGSPAHALGVMTPVLAAGVAVAPAVRFGAMTTLFGSAP